MQRRQFCKSLSYLLMLGALPTLLNGCQDPTELQIIQLDHQDQAFPVTINHALGSTYLTEEPKRIICLGAGAEDIVLSLGILPIAIESHIWGGDHNGYLPWFKEAVLSQGDILPEVIHMYPELEIAKIIRLKPDLIIAPQSGLTPEIYRQLSGTVPIIAYPERPWLTPVEQQVSMIAAALGKSEQGQIILNNMHKEMMKYRALYPEFRQYTFAYLNAGSRMSHLSAYVIGDPRVDSLIALGLKPAAFMNDLKVKQGAFAATIGLENIDLLDDVDIVVSWYNSEKVKQEVDQIPLFNAIPAIKNRAYIPLTDQALVMSMSYGSPLSLPWGIQRFLPLLLEVLPNASRSHQQVYT